jgi:hypothetical protein
MAMDMKQATLGLKKFVTDQGWLIEREWYGTISDIFYLTLRHPHYKTFTELRVREEDIEAAEDAADLFVRCMHPHEPDVFVMPMSYAESGSITLSYDLPAPREHCKHAGERERRADFTGTPTYGRDGAHAMGQRKAHVQQLQEQALASLKRQLRDWPVCNLSNTPLTIEWDFVRGVSPGTQDTQEAYWHCAHCQSEKGAADDTAED